MTARQLAITRIVNACVLIELGGHMVLTDPYFEDRWFVRLREPIGMKAADLPRLTAILGGHGVFDHWQPRSLSEYRFKQSTRLFVANQSMMRKAKAGGFDNVEILGWGETRIIAPRLTLEVVAAQRMVGLTPNNYVLSTPDFRVFIGTEARDLESLRQYRKVRPGVDVALLPIDGSALAGHKLVMDPGDAVQGAHILGAKVLVPFHYALRPVPLLLQTPGSIAQLERSARNFAGLDVVPLRTGERWVSPQSSLPDDA